MTPEEPERVGMGTISIKSTVAAIAGGAQAAVCWDCRKIGLLYDERR